MRMLRNRYFTALAVTAVVTLVLLVLPTRLSQHVRTAISNTFLPLFGLSTAADVGSDEIATLVLPKRVLAQENQKLRRKNAELLLQLAASEQVKLENERLRDLLGWQPGVPWNLKLARVVLRDPANWWRAVQIDLGNRDGVAPDATVLTPEGLVGRVSSVGFDHAQVVLLGDPNCRVSALIENDERDTGIVGASTSLDSSLLEMTFLPRHAKLSAGQPVRTSGLGGVFPKGILLGHVVDAQSAEYGLYLSARIRTTVNFSALEEVWVIVQ